ncbi:MAG: hypothetical protein NC085_10950 [Muribaculaceae bacterium]|nr:hypothetical protein [Muribaculaceae bacterium]
MRGRDIKRYSYEFADLWLIHIPWHFPLHNNSEIQGVSIEAEHAFEKFYPAVYKHLSSFKKELLARNKAETGIRYEWYALQRWGANYSDDFSRQKIIYREISDEMNACLDNNGFFVNNKCYIVTGENLIYLLCFFNSPIFNKIILKETNITGGKGADFMNTINVPLINKKILSRFEELYNELKRSLNIKGIENEINKILFSLYNFSDEEINYLLSK